MSPDFRRACSAVSDEISKQQYRRGTEEPLDTSLIVRAVLNSLLEPSDEVLKAAAPGYGMTERFKSIWVNMVRKILE